MFRTSQLILMFVVLSALPASAQLVDDMEDESRLYAQSKQVNQFFRRFNGEEDEKGKRYFPGDRLYRSTKLRKNYLSILFDESNTGIAPSLKADFTRSVLDRAEPAILNFHGGNWFSEVEASFVTGGKVRKVILFLELERHKLGTRWVINKVFGEMFTPYFVKDTSRVGKFLHPLSHELEFMNLRKALESDSLSQFALKKFTPDHLTLFLYELQRGNLRFKSVEQVKFHFFQIDGWYFELSLFNRPGYNTGWLISNLVRISSPGDRAALQKHLYYETP